MKAHLLAIDDVTLFPLKREDALLLFKLVNDFQEKTSLIITANKALTRWLETLEDEAITAGPARQAALLLRDNQARRNKLSYGE